MAEHVLDLVLLRHVGFVCISLGARSTDRLDYRLGGILARHVIDHDIGTGLPESDRGRLADAGIGAGDQCLLARQDLRNGPLRGAGWQSDVLFRHDRLPLTSTATPSILLFVPAPLGELHAIKVDRGTGPALSLQKAISCPAPVSPVAGPDEGP